MVFGTIGAQQAQQAIQGKQRRQKKKGGGGRKRKEEKGGSKVYFSPVNKRCLLESQRDFFLFVWRLLCYSFGPKTMFSIELLQRNNTFPVSKFYLVKFKKQALKDLERIY